MLLLLLLLLLQRRRRHDVRREHGDHRRMRRGTIVAKRSQEPDKRDKRELTCALLLLECGMPGVNLQSKQQLIATTMGWGEGLT